MAPLLRAAPLLVIAALLLAPADLGAREAPDTPAQAPAAPTPREIVLEATALPCADQTDGVCLAYDGRIPGPTLVIRQGETVAVTLVNRVAETAAALSLPPATLAKLTTLNVSFHMHGQSVPAGMDGVSAMPGTRIGDSTAPPGGTYRYVFQALHPGAWHYHDHAMGTGPHQGGMSGHGGMGPMGNTGDHGSVVRGLYGGILVLAPDEPTPIPLDLHLLDAGPNGGRGLHAAVPTGAAFDLLVVGLGNYVWDVELLDPHGASLGLLTLGPGNSDAFHIPSAQPGTYRWIARTAFHAAPFEGEVVVA